MRECFLTWAKFILNRTVGWKSLPWRATSVVEEAFARSLKMQQARWMEEIMIVHFWHWMKSITEQV